ncbi:MAG: FkbM family methyltransferase [Arenimonas sp.]
MKKILVDVGGYEGDACLAALDPAFDFDVVYCFEPVKKCADSIKIRVSHPKLEVINAALSNFDGNADLFGPGTLAGSLFSDHEHVNSQVAEQCRVVRATGFLLPLVQSGDEIYVKLNCEGAEIPILEDLLDSGVFLKLKSVLLDLDAKKIPSLSERLSKIEEDLAKIESRNWFYPEEVQFGQQCTFGGIRNWLKVSGARAPGVSSKVTSFRYHLSLWNKGEFRGYYKFLLARRLPKFFMIIYYKYLRPKTAAS